MPGDIIDFQSAGGGGFGAPLERDIMDVERDVTCGYVSIEKAKNDYGVVIDTMSLKVDQEATRSLRASMSDRNAFLDADPDTSRT